MSAPNYVSRRTKVQRQLKSLQVDALLLSGLSNVRYLTGFTGDSSWLLLTSRSVLLISDTRYDTQLKSECPDVEVAIRDAGRTLTDAAADAIADSGAKRVGFEAEQVTFSVWEHLKERLSKQELVGTSGVVERFREVKDKWELEQIRAAIHFAQRGFQVVRSQLRKDQTETEIRYVLEDAMRSFGATGPGFEPIVGVGPTAALPHAHAGLGRVSEHPVLLIDWGAATASGYRSDLTRVLLTGRPNRQITEVYSVVLAAQQAAIQAIRPGAKCSDVDAIARDYIRDAGYGQYFGHGLGHGFGLDIHESLRMSPLSRQVFEPGMVVTVEPGIYLPGKFGVRIEDDVLVTADGNEVLTSLPRDFESATVGFLE